MESFPNLTTLNGPISSLNFAILTRNLPKLTEIELLLCEESHLSLVSDRCPNLKLLVLQYRPDMTDPQPHLTSIGCFVNVSILDVFCATVVPQFSKLPQLRELVLTTTHLVTEEWVKSLCKEISNSVQFLSLRSMRTEGAELLLENVSLTVLKIYVTRASFRWFCNSFDAPRDNPKHFIAEDGIHYLWNGVTTFEAPFLCRRRYLTLI